jgi:DNA relaxase NicK
MGGQRDTVYVSLSGGALGYFSNEGLDVFGWLSYLLDLGVVIKRVDLAFDDHDMLINLAKVRRAVRDGSCVTHARSSREVRDLQGGHGWTIYIGSRTSPTMVRIYDKAAEQQVGRWWVRVEVEYKRERAHQVVLAWRDAGFSVLAGVGFLRGSVDFRVNDGTATKSRWALADWWAKFVGQVKARRVRVPLPDRTIEDVARWLHKSVAGALAAFTEVYGDGALRRLVHRGDRIMSRSHRRLVMAAI